jgi:hypothetical protein
VEEEDRQDLKKRFTALMEDEKVAFVKEAMSEMVKIFGNAPKRMTLAMVPFCTNMIKSKDMDKMRSMVKGMIGRCCPAVAKVTNRSRSSHLSLKRRVGFVLRPALSSIAKLHSSVRQGGRSCWMS